MQVAELIVRAVGILIWPAIIIAILVLFRKQIRHRLGAVTKAEFPGGLKLDFSEGLSELETSVRQSLVSTETLPPSLAQGPSEDLLALGDARLAVAGTRLEMEREVRQLARLTGTATEYRAASLPFLVGSLRDWGPMEPRTVRHVLDYVNLADQLLGGTPAGADEVARALSIGATLLARLQHLRRVAHLLEDFEGHGLWHMRGTHDTDDKYMFWSAIAATLPEFDYSYEAYREAAERCNEAGGARASETWKVDHRIYVPSLEEFIRILEHRRAELRRVIEAGGNRGFGPMQTIDWQWPKEWGRIGWSGPIVHSLGVRQAEDDLLRTEAAIQRYRALLSVAHPEREGHTP